jgi:Protein of unknown function (DUF3098)
MSNEKKQMNTGGSSNPLFGKDNYMWMLIGLAVLALGFFLMVAGAATPKYLMQMMYTAPPGLRSPLC